MSTVFQFLLTARQWIVNYPCEAHSVWHSLVPSAHEKRTGTRLSVTVNHDTNLVWCSVLGPLLTLFSSPSGQCRSDQKAPPSFLFLILIVYRIGYNQQRLPLSQNRSPLRVVNNFNGTCDEVVCSREPCKSANQILLSKFRRGTQIHNPPFLFGDVGTISTIWYLHKTTHFLFACKQYNSFLGVCMAGN